MALQQNKIDPRRGWFFPTGATKYHFCYNQWSFCRRWLKDGVWVRGDRSDISIALRVPRGKQLIIDEPVANLRFKREWRSARPQIEDMCKECLAAVNRYIKMDILSPRTWTGF